MRVGFVALLILLSVCVANASLVEVPSVIKSNGVVGKPSNFSVNLAVNTEKEHVPVDVVLAIDCSPSMGRFSRVIYGPTLVNLTKVCCCGRWVAIGNFTLDKTSDVEVMLSYPHEDYYNESGMGFDRVSVYISNYTGMWMGCGWMSCTDPAVFEFPNVPPGTHTIYAKIYGMPRTEVRTLVVALPPKRIDAAKNASKDFVGMLGDGDRVGVVRIGSTNTTYVALNLTDDKLSVNSTIDDLTLDYWMGIDVYGRMCCGCCMMCRMVRIFELTALGDGLKLACDMLNSSGREHSIKAIILLTDGDWNNGIDPIDVARIASRLGYRIYTIGFGVVNQSLLEKIAEITGGKYYYAPSYEDLKSIYDEIYRDITVYATNVTLKLDFPNPQVRFVRASPSPSLVNGSTVEWHWNSLNESEIVTVWVNSSVAGNLVVANGTLSYDVGGGRYVKKFTTVVMNFTAPPFIVHAVPDKKAIREGESVNVTITANYPIANVSYSAIPSINGTNGLVNLSVSGKEAVFNWTPFYNYVDSNTTAVIKFNVTSVYGTSNETEVSIGVINVAIPPVIVRAEPNVTQIYEGETVRINVTSNYPIGNVTCNITGATSANSVINVTVSGKNATILWTPLYNYTTFNVNAVVTIGVVSPPYGSNATSLTVTVLNEPLIVSVNCANSVEEGQTLAITVKTNLPMKQKPTLTGNPTITPSNGLVTVEQKGSTSAVIYWTPYTNYVNEDTNAVLTVSVTDIYGDTNATSKYVTVYNLNVPPGNVTVERDGDMYIVTYENPKLVNGDVGFKITLNGKPIDYRNSSFILTYFRKNSSAWTLEITPQYNFTNKLSGNITLNVAFYDRRVGYLNSAALVISNTTVSFYPIMLNVSEFDNISIRWFGSVGFSKAMYVGEEIRMRFVNATGVTVNGVSINPTTPVFIPNAAGEYDIRAVAGNTVLRVWKDVPIRIKPVSPS